MLLVAIFVACSTTADATSEVRNEEPPSDLELAKDLGRELEHCRLQRDMDRALFREHSQIKLAAAAEREAIKLKAEREKAEAQLAGLRAEIAALEKARLEAEDAAERSWYESPSMWFWSGMVGGVVLGFGLAVGSTWGVSQLTDAPLRPAVP